MGLADEIVHQLKSKESWGLDEVRGSRWCRASHLGMGGFHLKSLHCVIISIITVSNEPPTSNAAVGAWGTHTHTTARREQHRPCIKGGSQLLLVSCQVLLEGSWDVVTMNAAVSKKHHLRHCCKESRNEANASPNYILQ